MQPFSWIIPESRPLFLARQGSVNRARGWNQTWNLLPNKGFRSPKPPFLTSSPFLSLILSLSSFHPHPLHLSACLSRKVISITLPPCWFRIQSCPLQSRAVNAKRPFNVRRETLLGTWDGNASLPPLISLGLDFHSPELPSMSRVSPQPPAPPRPPDWWVNPPWLPQSSSWECQKKRMDNKLLMNWGGTNLDPSAWP